MSSIQAYDFQVTVLSHIRNILFQSGTYHFQTVTSFPNGAPVRSLSDCFRLPRVGHGQAANGHRARDQVALAVSKQRVPGQIGQIRRWGPLIRIIKQRQDKWMHTRGNTTH